MFEKYNDGARRSLFFARYEASKLGFRVIESEHILLGILREGEETVLDICRRFKVDPDELRREIEGERKFVERISSTTELPLSEESKKILVYTSHEAEVMRRPMVGSEHILLGILRTEDCTAMRILTKHGFDIHTTREVILDIAKARGFTSDSLTPATSEPPPPKRNKIFISYSHRDREWLERLQTMLKPALRGGGISLWDDTRITAGAKWRDEITRALTSARVAVFLVSGDFLASDFVIEHELPPLLKAAEREGVKILWIYLSHCLYDETDLVHYQAAHDISAPLEDLSRSEQNRVLAQICRTISKEAQS